MNRYISEPHVFGLGVFIARFALYYDLNMTSNLAFNFLIGLLVSKKFFSLLPLLIFRLKIKIFITSFLQFLKNFSDSAQIICTYIRMFIVDPFNIYFFPVFLWSLITGSTMKFISFKKSDSPILNYIFPFPTPPKGNIFWDFPKEIINIEKRKIELFVYFSYLNSIKNNLCKLIKTGQFGIVDENSFFLFIKDEYAILVHILSKNSFSIKFKIRCLQFTKEYINHELSYIKLDKTLRYLQSNYSPISQKVRLDGFNHKFINIYGYNSIFIRIGGDIRRSWMSYAIISYYLKNQDKFFLSELFDFPFPDENNDKYNKLDENVFSQFESEFKDSPERVFAFLNLIYREINRNSDSFECFFTEYYKFTNKFPLFKNHNDLNTNNEYEDDLLNHEFNLFDIEQVPEPIDNDENEEEDCDQIFIKNVKWLIKESAKRVCLYWILVLNLNAPSLEDKAEVIEFINDIEDLYFFADNDDNTWENLTMLIRGQKNKNNTEINSTYDIESLKIKTIFTVVSYNRQIKAVLLAYDIENWSVYKLNRESVRSIWATECFNTLYLDRKHSIVEDKCIRNIIIQTSDLPNENPAYVSGTEESYFSYSFLK